jgi:hypothetical protein
MSGWSSYKKEKQYFSNWRSFLNEEFYAAGITSQEMPDSLRNMIKPLMSQGLTQQQGNALIRLFFELAKEEDVLLEVSLGDTGTNRTFSGEATAKVGELINSFGLDQKLSRKLVQTINRWATINQIKMEKPTSAPASTPAPSQADDARPTSAAAGAEAPPSSSPAKPPERSRSPQADLEADVDSAYGATEAPPRRSPEADLDSDIESAYGADERPPRRRASAADLERDVDDLYPEEEPTPEPETDDEPASDDFSSISDDLDALFGDTEPELEEPTAEEEPLPEPETERSEEEGLASAVDTMFDDVEADLEDMFDDATGDDDDRFDTDIGSLAAGDESRPTTQPLPRDEESEEDIDVTPETQAVVIADPEEPEVYLSEPDEEQEVERIASEPVVDKEELAQSAFEYTPSREADEEEQRRINREISQTVEPENVSITTDNSAVEAIRNAVGDTEVDDEKIKDLIGAYLSSSESDRQDRNKTKGMITRFLGGVDIDPVRSVLQSLDIKPQEENPVSGLAAMLASMQAGRTSLDDEPDGDDAEEEEEVSPMDESKTVNDYITESHEDKFKKLLKAFTK